MTENPGVILRSRASLIWIVAILCGAYYFLDWSRLWQTVPDLMDTLVRIGKVTTSLLCTVILLAGFPTRRSNKDAGLLLASFLVINLGDVCFALKWPGLDMGLTGTIGIAFFLIAQIIMTVRNWSTGFDRRFATITGIIMGLLCVGMIVAIAVLGSMFHGTLPFPVVVVYALIVSFSTWVALQNFKTDKFPLLIDRLVARGMILFFLCDCTVGLSHAMPGSTVGLVADSLTWMLYIPALLHLALSVTEHPIDAA